MALTKSVSKTSVALALRNMWSVSLTLVVTDDGQGPGFERTFSKNHKLGHSIPGLAAKFDEAMQAAIDEYKAEQVYFTHPQLDALVVTIDDGLEV